MGKYGLHQTDACRGSAIANQVKSATDGWAACIGRELLQPTIVRPEADKLVDLLDSADSLLLLMGAAGGGKTAVLHQVFQTLDAGATPTLGLRLDRLNSFSTTNGFPDRFHRTPSTD
ncbi:hypothetical protein [Streptomyces sp. NPDC059076]|uniref:hypothetical protein n=1 Tax=unclassified Streptomyces TaxID=2593676 RepID=UPI0036C56B02